MKVKVKTKTTNNVIQIHMTMMYSVQPIINLFKHPLQSPIQR
jgi:hypothetical protein